MKRAVVALALALALASCGGGEHSDVDVSIIQNPNTATGVDEKVKMPVIKFEKQLHDFGTLTMGENISYSFKFTNEGNAPLVISGCDATCGCTVPDWPRDPIAPGKSGYVTVAFRSEGKAGMQLQEVTVMANTQPSATKLRIQAKVR